MRNKYRLKETVYFIDFFRKKIVNKGEIVAIKSSSIFRRNGRVDMQMEYHINPDKGYCISCVDEHLVFSNKEDAQNFFQKK